MAASQVELARARRGARAAGKDVRFQWFLDTYVQKLNLTMEQRVRRAARWLMDKVVRNISRPVTKTPTSRIATRTVGGVARKKGSQYTKVSDRSKPGEFPKADTTQLMKGIFDDVRLVAGGWEGYVGTPLEYGAILELSEDLDRRYLTRTLFEEAAAITRILTGPVA